MSQNLLLVFNTIYLNVTSKIFQLSKNLNNLTDFEFPSYNSITIWLFASFFFKLRISSIDNFFDNLAKLLLISK